MDSTQLDRTRGTRGEIAELIGSPSWDATRTLWMPGLVSAIHSNYCNTPALQVYHTHGLPKTTNQCTIWKLQWGSGHRIFSIFRRKQRFHIVDPIQLSPHNVFSHFSTSNLVTSSCIYPSSSWESESPWYLVTACVRKNEVKYLIFNIFQTKNAFWGY